MQCICNKAPKENIENYATNFLLIIVIKVQSDVFYFGRFFSCQKVSVVHVITKRSGLVDTSNRGINPLAARSSHEERRYWP